MMRALGIFAKASTNGKIARADSTDDQRERMGELGRALKGESIWKGVSKLLGCALVASIAYNGLMSLQFAPRVVTQYVDPVTGRVIATTNARDSVPVKEQSETNAALLAFVQCVREVPRSDFGFIDASEAKCHAMTAHDSSAERDLLAFYRDHGPKANAAKCSRMVVLHDPDPLYRSEGGNTYSIDYAEQTRPVQSQGAPTVLRWTGRVSFAQMPAYTADGLSVQIDSFDLPKTDCS